MIARRRTGPRPRKLASHRIERLVVGLLHLNVGQLSVHGFLRQMPIILGALLAMWSVLKLWEIAV
jgi:hypothetical protein